MNKPSLVVLLAMLSTLCFGQGHRPEVALSTRQVQPIVDTPLRDPAICRGPDGTYYLTGTSATAGDFLNNEGIRLWKSRDLLRWEPVGKVWDLAKDAQSRWMRRRGVPPGDPDALPVRGIAAPEIHYLKGTFWIPYGMSHGGTGLLKSKTGKAEGPYQDLGLITLNGFDPSLFEDDGKVYYVFGEGWIAPLTEDMTRLAEAPVLLRPEPLKIQKGYCGQKDLPAFTDHNPTVGSHGAFLFKEHGLYHLCAARPNNRLSGTAVHDTFVATSPNLMGPYSEIDMLIPHGGQTTVFRDDNGNLYGTFGGDKMAVFHDRAGIVPLRYDGFLKHVWKPNLTSATKLPLPHPVHQAVVVEGGGVGTLTPMQIPGAENNRLRDATVLNAPDGWYYMTGLPGQNSADIGIYGWKSKDLKNWEFMGKLWDPIKEKWPHSLKGRPSWANYLNVEFGPDLWPASMQYVKGNYYIAWGPAYGGSYLLRSKTGKPEGPYEDLGMIHDEAIAPVIFVDDDGAVYFVCSGGVSIAQMKPDMTGVAESFRNIGPADGSHLGHEGPDLIKAHGKYILFLTQISETVLTEVPQKYRRNTYDIMYCWADNINGPYSTAKLAVPHAGENGVFQAKDGRWYCTYFGQDATAPFNLQFALVPLEILWENNEILIQQGAQ